MRVAICDDEKTTAQATEELLLAFDAKLFEIDVYFTPQRFLQGLTDNQYDCFILDIEMPGASGIQLAEAIREENPSAPIIFLTSYKQYMEKVFRLQTFDYIIKPATKDKLFPVLKQVTKVLANHEHRFTFEFNRISYSIPFREIIYFEKDRRTLLIHTVKETYRVNMTTDQLVEKIGDHFVQIHLSYFVNSHFIKEIHHAQLILRVGEDAVTLPISRRFQMSAKKKIMQQMRELI